MGESTSFQSFLLGLCHILERKIRSPKTIIQISIEVVDIGLSLNIVSQWETFDWQSINAKLRKLLNSGQFLILDNIKVETLLINYKKGHAPGVEFCNLRLAKYILSSSKRSCFYDSLAYSFLKYKDKNQTRLEVDKILQKGRRLALEVGLPYNQPVGISELLLIDSEVNDRLTIFSYSSSDKNKVLYIHQLF